MKYLKSFMKINELNKTTYLNAGKKLIKLRHRDRGLELINMSGYAISIDNDIYIYDGFNVLVGDKSNHYQEFHDNEMDKLEDYLYESDIKYIDIGIEFLNSHGEDTIPHIISFYFNSNSFFVKLTENDNCYLPTDRKSALNYKKIIVNIFKEIPFNNLFDKYFNFEEYTEFMYLVDSININKLYNQYGSFDDTENQLSSKLANSILFGKKLKK
jgi:hypothetical protein